MHCNHDFALQSEILFIKQIKFVFIHCFYKVTNVMFVFSFSAFFIATQVLYTIGFIFLLVACIGVLAIQLCFIIDREIFAMKVLAIAMFLSGK